MEFLFKGLKKEVSFKYVPLNLFFQKDYSAVKRLTFSKEKVRDRVRESESVTKREREKERESESVTEREREKVSVIERKWVW